MGGVIILEFSHISIYFFFFLKESSLHLTVPVLIMTRSVR